jgi:N utilization substance protein A
MPRKSQEEAEAKFSGKFDVEKFDAALSEIEEAHQITKEQTHKILTAAIDKAARDTIYPNPKTNSSKDMHSETIIDETTGEISFYQCQDVMNDDDIEDDLYQINPEAAKEADPDHKDYKVGDVFKTKVDISKFDYSFFTRAIQNFMQNVKSATKQALIDRYSDRIGTIISGTVEKIDGGFTTIAVDKIMATLSPQSSIPGEHFIPGDTIKVLLKGIGTSEEGGDKSTSLLLSRVDDNFLKKLFEQEIPDIADGSVVINGIVREPGNRAKVAVSSPSPDVDPTGACIGSDGSRIKDICAQLSNEKIDVIKYQDNPYLYIAEALKPATVVGVVFLDDPVEEGKSPKAVAIVKNAESKIAIGKKGVNVRLASRLTGYSIDIKEQDAAMAEHISYTNIDDIKRKIALERLDQEEAAAPEEGAAEEAVEGETPVENPETAEAPAAEQTAPTEAAKPAEAPAAPTTPTAPAPETIPAAAPAPTAVAAAASAPAAKPAEKPISEVEHVEITTKAKISLDKLEAEIEAEKKAKQKPTYHNYRKPKDENKEDKTKKPDVANAMPIYTEEELKKMDEEEKQDKGQEGTNEEGEDYSEYDSDQYYEDDGTKK